MAWVFSFALSAYCSNRSIPYFQVPCQLWEFVGKTCSIGSRLAYRATPVALDQSGKQAKLSCRCLGLLGSLNADFDCAAYFVWDLQFIRFYMTSFPEIYFGPISISQSSSWPLIPYKISWKPWTFISIDVSKWALTAWSSLDLETLEQAAQSVCALIQQLTTRDLLVFEVRCYLLLFSISQELQILPGNRQQYLLLSHFYIRNLGRLTLPSPWAFGSQSMFRFQHLSIQPRVLELWAVDFLLRRWISSPLFCVLLLWWCHLASQALIDFVAIGNHSTGFEFDLVNFDEPHDLFALRYSFLSFAHLRSQYSIPKIDLASQW